MTYVLQSDVSVVPEPASLALLGIGLAALMAALGLANLVIALYFDLAIWAWFVSVGAKLATSLCNTPSFER